MAIITGELPEKPARIREGRFGPAIFDILWDLDTHMLEHELRVAHDCFETSNPPPL